MDTGSKYICSLCFFSIQDEKINEISTTTREILSVIFYNQPLEIGRIQTMCQLCSSKLQNAFDFKCTCIYTEDSLAPFFTALGRSQIDIREVYARNNGLETATVFSDYIKVCRLCLKLVNGNYKSLVRSAEYEMIRKYLPDIMVQNSLDPIACETCLDSLQNFVSFINNCLYSQDNQNNTSLSRTLSDNKKRLNGKEDYSKLGLPSFNLKESSNVKLEFTERKEETFDTNIDQETFDSYNSSSSDANSSIFLNHSYDSPRHGKPPEYEYNASVLYDLDQHTLRCNETTTQKEETGKGMYKCEHCSYRTKSKSNLTKHNAKFITTCKDQVYRCHECDYSSPHQNALKSHLLNHQHPSEIVFFHCEKCDYKTKYKSALKSHKLNHKQPSEIEMRKCNLCPYETKHRTALVVHMLKHKEPSEIQMYRCDQCEFKTKYKHALKPHKKKHK